jgi:hypothetical protein
LRKIAKIATARQLHSARGMHKALVIALASACSPVVYQTAVTPQPAADTRSAAQIAIDAISARGYQCSIHNQDQPSYVCKLPNGTWEFYVTQVVTNEGATELWLESFGERRFAKPCGSFAFALQDLTDTPNVFSVDCNDASKQFIFRTKLGADATFNSDWAVQHEANRVYAARKLRGIGALSDEFSRMVASAR